MRSMDSCTKAAMERAMREQEVILRVWASKMIHRARQRTYARSVRASIRQLPHLCEGSSTGVGCVVDMSPGKELAR